MTTIAYRDGVLAAETATCQGGVMIGIVVKIARRADGDMCGSAGDAAYNAAFTEWFLAREANGRMSTVPPKSFKSQCKSKA